MKKLFTLIFTTILLSGLYAQDETWLVNATSDLGLDSARGGYLYVVDINNDQYPDIAMVEATIIYGHIKLYLNKQKEGSSDPTERYFEDITEWSNIDLKRNGEHGRVIDNAVFGDIDNDGDVDVITGVYYHRWEYYHPDSLDPGDRCEVMLNRGNGRFDLLENSGLNTIGPHSGDDAGLVNVTGFSMLDYNLDGNIDVFVSSWFDDYKNNDMTASYLLKGNGDGTFTDVSTETNISKNKYPLYGINATDWNNDGWMDLATSPYCRSSGSLWENKQSGYFTDVASQVGYNTQYLNGDGWGDNDQTYAKPLCAWASQPADFDNDGDIDFFYCLVHGGFTTDVFGNPCGRSTIVRNSGKDNGYKLAWELDRVIRKAPRSSHLGDYDACWLDLDNDMLLDLAMGNGGYDENTRLFILQQDADTMLEDISRSLGFTGYSTMIREVSSVQPIDFDLDGDDDLLISHGNDEFAPRHEILLMENHIGEKNNWVGISLRSPSGCNANSIGSRITVYSGGVAQTREIKAGFGHFGGQQPFITNFGLAQNIIIDSIVVRWQTNPITYTKVINPQINDILVIDKNGLWGTLGTSEAPSKEEFILYPNPANSYIHIMTPENFGTQGTYAIIDVNGKVIEADRYMADDIGKISIQIFDLPKGYYFIRLNSENNILKTLAFVISK